MNARIAAAEMRDQYMAHHDNMRPYNAPILGQGAALRPGRAANASQHPERDASQPVVISDKRQQSGGGSGYGTTAHSGPTTSPSIHRACVIGTSIQIGRVHG